MRRRRRLGWRLMESAEVVAAAVQPRNRHRLWVRPDRWTSEADLDALLVEHAQRIDRGITMLQELRQLITKHEVNVGALCTFDGPEVTFSDVSATADDVRFTLMLLKLDSLSPRWVWLHVRLDTAGVLHALTRA